MPLDPTSPRVRVREAVAEILRSRGEPMHVTALAELSLAALGLKERLSAKDVNTALHDDAEGRFKLVGPATWTLN